MRVNSKRHEYEEGEIPVRLQICDTRVRKSLPGIRTQNYRGSRKENAEHHQGNLAASNPFVAKSTYRAAIPARAARTARDRGTHRHHTREGRSHQIAGTWRRQDRVRKALKYHRSDVIMASFNWLAISKFGFFQEETTHFREKNTTMQNTNRKHDDTDDILDRVVRGESDARPSGLPFPSLYFLISRHQGCWKPLRGRAMMCSTTRPSSTHRQATTCRAKERFRVMPGNRLNHRGSTAADRGPDKRNRPKQGNNHLWPSSMTSDPGQQITHESLKPSATGRWSYRTARSAHGLL